MYCLSYETFNWKTLCFSNSNIPEQECKEARTEHSKGTEINDTESMDMPREEKESASKEPDQDGKLEVDNIMFMIVIVSIITVS